MNSLIRKPLAVLLLLAGFGLIGWGISCLATSPPHETTARIKLEKFVTDSTGRLRVVDFDSELIQIEMGVIRTNVIPGRLIQPGWEQEWGSAYNDGKAPDAGEIIKRVQQHLDLRHVPHTRLIEIRVTDAASPVAATIANAIAEACRTYHVAEREKAIADSVASSVQSLEVQWRSLTQEIRTAAEQLQKLQIEAGISDDGSAEATVEDAKLQSFHELKRRLDELKQKRKDLEDEFGSSHQGPEVGSVSVEIIQRASAQPPPRPPDRVFGGSLMFAGLLAILGGLLLGRRTPPSVSRPGP